MGRTPLALVTTGLPTCHRHRRSGTQPLRLCQCSLLAVAGYGALLRRMSMGVSDSPSTGSPPRDEEVTNEGEECEVQREATLFEERDEVLSRLRRLLSSPSEAGNGGVEELEWLIRTLERYQEQSNLLDSSLEDMVTLVLNKVRQIVVVHYSSANKVGTVEGAFPYQLLQDRKLHELSQFVYTLCRVRGAKIVVRFFPPETADFEPVVSALQSQDRADHETWHIRYLLLLWLSMLVLVPFDICSIDSAVPTGTGSGGLVRSLCSLLMDYLRDPGPTRDAAAACLANLLKRPDMETGLLSHFLTWAAGVLETSSAGASHGDDVFLVTGVMQTLAALFKAGHRQKLLHLVSTILPHVHSFAADTTSSPVARQLKMKLLQRIGLTFLPPRVAGWRYCRGQRSLLDNLGAAGTESGAAGQRSSELSLDGNEAGSDDSGPEPPEELEEVIEQILCGLRDRHTVVRWSAAKGIGRITENLPMAYAADILDSVLQLLADEATESSWHGGCLALAELARRGLLLPTRLSDVVPLVVAAMAYDRRRGSISVGAHVRDAACYVCWAFARAYSPATMRPHVQALCDAMLVTSLFDREINCRRAASAAFQENVGRQGHENFPHGIDILTAADYYTLGNRAHAYLDVSRDIARIPRYTAVVIDHLFQVKLVHWDVAIRMLASRALQHLTALAPGRLMHKVIPALLSQVESPDLCKRHGSILGLAEAMLGLAKYPYPMERQEIVQRVRRVPEVIAKARLYRGRGGELVRSAVCRLIECMAHAELPLPVKLQVDLLTTLEEGLKHPLDDVEESAVAALRIYTRVYFPVGNAGPSERLVARVTGKYAATIMDNDNAAVTRGFSRALGSLPSKLLLPRLDTVLDCLAALAHPSRRVGDEPDAESRRNALLALMDVCRTTGLCPSGLNQRQMDRVVNAVFLALEDYSMDKRGDVGSWCRVAAMRTLGEVVKLAVVSPQDHHPQSAAKSSGRVVAEDRVVSKYGRGVVLASHVESTLADVQFDCGTFGAFYFPYHRTGRIRVESCKVAADSAGDLAVPRVAARSTALRGMSAVSCDVGSKRRGSTVPVDAALVVRVMRALVKQLSEKLDVVRQCAGEVLEDLLLSSSPRIPAIPERPALEAALLSRSSGPVHWASPSDVFPRVVKLLSTETYHRAVAEGLVVSIGGLTESIVRASTEAVLQWAAVAKQLKLRGPLVRFARTLLEVFEANKQKDRVILPLLVSVAALAEKGVFRFEVGHEVSFFWSEMVMKVRDEMRGSKDVKKLLACLDVLMHVLTEKHVEAPARQSAVSGVAVLLGHRFPRVRKATAEQWYIRLLENEELAPSPQAYEHVLEMLSVTAWDGDDLTHIRAQRDSICAHMQVATPQMHRTRMSHAVDNKRAKMQGDDLGSYSALVKEAGY